MAIRYCPYCEKRQTVQLRISELHNCENCGRSFVKTFPDPTGLTESEGKKLELELTKTATAVYKRHHKNDALFCKLDMLKLMRMIDEQNDKSFVSLLTEPLEKFLNDSTERTYLYKDADENLFACGKRTSLKTVIRILLMADDFSKDVMSACGNLDYAVNAETLKFILNSIQFEYYY